MSEPNKDLLTVHLDRLEDDAKEQPQLMYDWGLELAKAKKKTKQCEKRVKLAKVAADKEAREDPLGTMGLDKTTEPAVKAYVEGNEEVVQCEQDVIDAEYEQDILYAFVESLRDRREEIGNLTKLHGQMYWSKPDGVSQPTEQQRIAATQAASQPPKKRRF